MHLDLQHHTQTWLGLYERELHRTLRELSRDIRCAVDVGSADGSYVLYFLARTAARRVFSFEPDAAARAQLTGNLALNGFGGSDRLTMFDRPAGSGDAGAVALDELIGDMPTPLVIKVDVEGAELDVLHGAAGLLERGAAAWLIETHSATLEAEALTLLRTYDYIPRVITPAWWRLFLPETRPIPHNQWIVAAPRH